MFLKNIDKIAFTGNRGISSKNPTVIESLQKVYTAAPGATWIVGMAQGIDLVVAGYAYQNGIPFEAHIPFPHEIQTDFWSPIWKETHRVLLTKAARVVTYGDKYDTALYQKRNKGMASASDIVIAFNLRERGGTVNMINYCLSINKVVLDGFNDLKVMLHP